MEGGRKSIREMFDDISLSVISFLEGHDGLRQVQFFDRPAVTEAAIKKWHRENAPYRLPNDFLSFLSISDGLLLRWNIMYQGTELPLGCMQINPISQVKLIGEEELVGDEIEEESDSEKEDGGDADKRPKKSDTPAGSGSSQKSKSALPKAGPLVAKHSLMADSAESGQQKADAADFAFSNAASVAGNKLAIPLRKKLRPFELSRKGYRVYDLDSTTQNGRVALLYRPPKAAVTSSENSYNQPQVWYQDLSCDWYFIANAFTDYFRLLIMHLGLPHWQSAFTEAGMDPLSMQWFRFLSPQRLAIDNAHRDPRAAHISKRARPRTASSRLGERAMPKLNMAQIRRAGREISSAKGRAAAERPASATTGGSHSRARARRRAHSRAGSAGKRPGAEAARRGEGSGSRGGRPLSAPLRRVSYDGPGRAGYR